MCSSPQGSSTGTRAQSPQGNYKSEQSRIERSVISHQTKINKAKHETRIQHRAYILNDLIEIYDSERYADMTIPLRASPRGPSRGTPNAAKTISEALTSQAGQERAASIYIPRIRIIISLLPLADKV